MTKQAKTLKAEWEKAEAAAIKASTEEDERRSGARAKMQELNDRAAGAQKAYLDAEVKESLRDRPDGQTVADSLGISLDD